MSDRSEYINSDIPIKSELLRLFNSEDKLIVFDVGACEGEDSIRYANLFPKADIYSFEPNPENIKLIKKNFKTYDKLHVKIIEEALSDTIGKINFYVSSGIPDNIEKEEDWNYGNKSSSILPPKKVNQTHAWLKFNKTIEVNANTINAFCKKNNIERIDFVHMDVQGAELKVLEGASQMINKIKVIWLEVSTIELYKKQGLKKDIEKYMHQNNFFLYKNECSQSFGDQLYVNKIDYNQVEK
ncbi:MAG: FkbM family methyltransferase [Bacteroidia bacterium]